MLSLITIGGISLVYVMATLLSYIYIQELNSLEIEVMQIEERNKDLHKYEIAFDSVRNYEVLVKEAIKDTPDWETLLGGLTEVLPDGIWFDDITLNSEKDTIVCKITGRAVNRNSVAIWLDKFQELAYIRNADCKYINEIEDKTGKCYRYEINIDITKSEAPTKTLEGIIG